MANKIAPNIADVEAALATLGEMPELQYVPNDDKVRAQSARGSRARSFSPSLSPRACRTCACVARPRAVRAWRVLNAEVAGQSSFNPTLKKVMYHFFELGTFEVSFSGSGLQE